MLPPEHRLTSPNAETTSSSPFALLALMGTSRIRALHFPPDTYSRMTTYIKRNWRAGIEWATLQSGEGWDCLLKGTPWNKKGSEELESIRLILGILENLYQDGWQLLQEVQVGASKTDVHHFVFRHDSDVSVKTIKFFAVTFPLPNRVSLVDSPIPYTPAIISAIRSAILAPGLSLEEVQQTPIATQTEYSIKSGFKPDGGCQDRGALLPGTGTYQTRRDSSRRVARNKNLHMDRRTSAENGITVKDEAWVTPGVYGFALGGLSVFAGKGTSDFKRQPNLLVALLSKLCQQQSHLVASERLVPVHTRRDILIFGHTSWEDDLSSAEELVLPSLLRFPSSSDSPSSPGLSFETKATQKANRRSCRVRPSSLASVNGAPLLPSISASPSTPWGDADPSSYCFKDQNALLANSSEVFLLDRPNDEDSSELSRHLFPGPATAGPRIEGHTIPSHAAASPPSIPQPRHKKSASMPGKVAIVSKSICSAHIPPEPPMPNSRYKNADSRDVSLKSDKVVTDARLSSAPLQISPRSPTCLSSVSDGRITVKDTAAEPRMPVMANGKKNDAIRDSQRPEVGILYVQSSMQTQTEIDSADISANSSLKEKARTRSASGGGVKFFVRPRRSIRNFFKTLR